MCWLRYLLILCIPMITGAQSINVEVEQWLHTHIIDEQNQLRLNEHNLNIIATLLWYAYQRSYSTIQAQTYMLENIKYLWHAYENAMYRRVNPSHLLVYPSIEQKIDLQDFWTIYQQQQEWATQYAQALNFICNRAISPLNESQAFDAIDAVRTICRTYMFQSLSELPVWVTQLFLKHRGVIQSFWDSLPCLSAFSFAKIDRLHNQFIHESFNTLYQAEYTYAHLWEQIERKRANFYAICYQNIMPYLRTSTNSHMAMISLQGQEYIPHDQRTKPLPSSLITTI